MFKHVNLKAEAMDNLLAVLVSIFDPGSLGFHENTRTKNMLVAACVPTNMSSSRFTVNDYKRMLRIRDLKPHVDRRVAYV